DPAFQMITVTKKTGLGLKILGGINRNEGPLVYIQEIIPGGDCYKDGRLKPGDQLVSINKESMIGVSFEEAKSIITRAKLRSESAWDIAFIRQKSDSHLENPSCSSHLQATGEYGPQASKFSLISSPPEILIPKTSSTPKSTDAILPSFRRNQIKTGYKKTEQIPVSSSDNSPTDMSNTGKCTFNSFFLLFFSITLSMRSALNYLGIQPTKEQHQALRQQVQVDSKGTVSFGGNETKAVVEETRALRSRLHLAEAAQRQAHGMEMDYEEVIRLLEAEITELKAQLADYSDQNKESVQELRKRITVLDCQLRKSEMARKTFEASTEKLLHFVEAIQDVFSDNSAPLSNLSERRALLASQTSLTPLGKNGHNLPATLALESKELVKSVRAILDMDWWQQQRETPAAESSVALGIPVNSVPQNPGVSSGCLREPLSLSASLSRQVK
ncbi:hypothetical protein FD754_010040, partial [Muntiacus muntjak]